MNGDYLLKRARAMVKQMDSDGYLPPIPGKTVYALGERGMAYLMQVAQSMAWSGFITEHEKQIADKLAYVLSGGPLSSPQWVKETYILELERDAFLSLCGMEKTVDRIKQMLLTGKPLRN
jgi:3-hydroxyacyl-CoA dehydrogenase